MQVLAIYLFTDNQVTIKRVNKDTNFKFIQLLQNNAYIYMYQHM